MSRASRLRLARSRDRRRSLLDGIGVLAYGVAWVSGYYVSTDYWFLPAGLRFASLWCLPRRLWPWLALSEFGAITFTVLTGPGYRTTLGFVLGVIVPWLVHAAVVAVAAPRRRELEPSTPWRMVRLLLAMLMAALLTSLALLWMSAAESTAPLADPTFSALGFAIGDFIAMMIVVPIWLHFTRRASTTTPRMLVELLAVFLPLLLIVLLLPGMRSRASLYVGILALLPMVFLVIRHGWRGAGFALGLTSVTVYALGETLSSPYPRDLMQLFLANVGAVTLMLGASVAALREARDALGESNVVLAEQAEALRALGQRLVHAQEEEQRRIAHEVHGELERGVSAIGARLGLLARTPLEPSQIAAIDSLRMLTQSVQGSIREVLVRLRPELLDRFGLEHALQQGPIHDLLVDSEIQLHLVTRGDCALLDPSLQGSIYRMCQEAATDCVRRATARHFHASVRVGEPHAGVVDVELRLRYEVRTQAAIGEETLAPVLPGVSDRVLALGGEYSAVHEDRELVHTVRLNTGSRSPGG